jgi:hypothetical protein
LTIAAATIAACDGAAARSDAQPNTSSAIPDARLSARFAYPNARTVQLDYLDQRNFRLADDTQSSETLAIDGRIYLHIFKSADRGEEVWRFGSLKTPQPDDTRAPMPKLQPTLIPPQGVAQWGIAADVFDVTMTTPESPEFQHDASIAKLPALARAQWVIAASLLPAMNMSLCGNAVEQVTRSWNVSLTRAGWAVLATSDGFRLDGRIEALGSLPTLPAGVVVRETVLE